jgi:hypothetical protein
MGLFVVARLAARHGIRVRLRPAATGGLIALVWLPDEAITHGGLHTAADPDGSDSAMAMSEVVAGSAAGSGRGPGWVTTGSPSSFRTVPRPADETGAKPGGTGPKPIVRRREEPLAEPGNESADVDSQATAAVTFGTGEDSVAAAARPFDTGLAPVLGGYGDVASGLPGGEADYRSASRADDPSGELDADAWSNAVVAPPAERFGTRNRLPNFEAVESDWFRQDGQAMVRFGSPGEEVIYGWSSPADEGWRAAEVVHAPSSGGVTSVGLPKRVPRANLVPGSAAAAESPGLAPARSAAATRDRFSSFQRGSREGRAVAGGSGSDGGEEGGSG